MGGCIAGGLQRTSGPENADALAVCRAPMSRCECAEPRRRPRDGTECRAPTAALDCPKTQRARRGGRRVRALHAKTAQADRSTELPKRARGRQDAKPLASPSPSARTPTLGPELDAKTRAQLEPLTAKPHALDPKSTRARQVRSSNSTRDAHDEAPEHAQPQEDQPRHGAALHQSTLLHDASALEVHLEGGSSNTRRRRRPEPSAPTAREAARQKSTRSSPACTKTPRTSKSARRPRRRRRSGPKSTSSPARHSAQSTRTHRAANTRRSHRDGR